ncbi:hypothetical protein GQ53DRAFT_832769 [Thozetella sp. PMI_491]|nr:hypothetical protein GQ53DRAFT_832769 [Thozetella sp. PMI_491]
MALFDAGQIGHKGIHQGKEAVVEGSHGGGRAGSSLTYWNLGEWPTKLVEIINGTEEEAHLEKRSGTTDISAYLWASACSGSSDWTWGNVNPGGCFSFIDSSGNFRDMYSLKSTRFCDFIMYHNHHTCGSGGFEQLTTQCANRGGSSIKSFKVLDCN